jgi:hypothetical protein
MKFGFPFCVKRTKRGPRLFENRSRREYLDLKEMRRRLETTA